MSLKKLGTKIKQASLLLPIITTEQKQTILREMADEILASRKSIKDANSKDIKTAEVKIGRAHV